MTRTSRPFAAAALVAASSFAGFVAAEHPPPRPGSDPAFEAILALEEPGPEHAILGGLVGTFDCRVVSWSAPDAAPQESNATLEGRWILGGRFVQQDLRSRSVDRPFEGMGLIGFDNVARKYVSVWIDTMGTGVTVFSGDYDAKRGALDLTAARDDPETKRRRSMRGITRFVSEGVHVWTAFEAGPDGKEHRTMEITSTRRPESSKR